MPNTDTPKPRFGGPGSLVAAAFVGPGTVTTCTLAGANFGFALLWALVFATIATIALQDMAARLGAGVGSGLGEALTNLGGNDEPTSGASGHRLRRYAMIALIAAALGIGNAAYEAGNLSGGAIGISVAFGLEGQLAQRLIVLALSGAAVVMILRGRLPSLIVTLSLLVGIMIICFATSAILVRPSLADVVSGLRPAIPEAGLLTTVALVGTTIVPYNLFLHAAASRDRFYGAKAVKDARKDSALSIAVGGLVSILILVTAATSLFAAGQPVTNAGDMALVLEPTFGTSARIVVGLGLAAAGLTSAVTAPLATGYALSEIFGKTEKERQGLFKIVAISVVAFGAFTATLGINPITVILFAQYTNGLLLPVTAGFLLWIMNKKERVGEYANGGFANGICGLVLVLTVLLGVRSIARAAGIWP
ncbi:MAG: divalent metal cation transporter [Pseudomonadota bacterium]